jgi:hypothetical protein
MSVPSDVIRVPAFPALPVRPVINEATDAAPPPSLHQEINARRARVENPELLRRLRGL